MRRSDAPNGSPLAKRVPLQPDLEEGQLVAGATEICGPGRSGQEATSRNSTQSLTTLNSELQAIRLFMSKHNDCASHWLRAVGDPQTGC